MSSIKSKLVFTFKNQHLCLRHERAVRYPRINFFEILNKLDNLLRINFETNLMTSKKKMPTISTFMTLSPSEIATELLSFIVMSSMKQE